MRRFLSFLPVLIAVALAAGGLALLWNPAPRYAKSLRLPEPPRPQNAAAATVDTVLLGSTQSGPGAPALLPGLWPCFRGENRDAVSIETAPLARSWPESGPRKLWTIPVGEGYAGAAVRDGRVFMMDYDRENQQSVLRALSLADGQEIWRYAYAQQVKRNHGMTRTVPATTEDAVVAMDPLCNVVCVEAATGKLRWGINLVRQFGTVVPLWYAGQCPLIEENRVILAPGGKEVLMMAVDLQTGEILWKTPNPHKWQMTHSSITPMEFEGERMYLYCGSGGVVAVSAQDGRILWETTEWKVRTATIGSPVVVPDGRIFFADGYNVGSMMMQLEKQEGKITSKVLWRLPESVFGAVQQTPVFWEGFIYGIRAPRFDRGEVACLDLEGKIRWTSPREKGKTFGIGPLMIAEGMILALSDEGRLAIFEATPNACVLLAESVVFEKGHEAWGPFTLAAGRLILRDFERMICLDLKKP